MFERFTDRARRVVTLAQDEARLFDHSTIGTEHLLLGLVREAEGVGGQALLAMGISVGDVRILVEEIVGRGTQPPTGHVPFTPRAKQVIELSLREALMLGHSYIGTEHILLGLIREGEGVAAQVLVKLGADLSRVRQQVIQLLSRRPDTTSADVSHKLESLRLRAKDLGIIMGSETNAQFRALAVGSETNVLFRALAVSHELNGILISELDSARRRIRELES